MLGQGGDGLATSWWAAAATVFAASPGLVDGAGLGRNLHGNWRAATAAPPVAGNSMCRRPLPARARNDKYVPL